MKQRIGQKLVVEVFDVDFLRLLAVAAPDLVARDRFNLADITHLHLDELRPLLLVLLLHLLLGERPLVHADEVVEHPVRHLLHIFHSLVVDADRRRQQLG